MSYTKRFLDDMALVQDTMEDALGWITRVGPRGPEDEEWDSLSSNLIEAIATVGKYVAKLEALNETTLGQ